MMNDKQLNFAASIYIHHLPSDTKYISDPMYGDKERVNKVKKAVTSKPDQITMNVNGDEIVINKGVIENSTVQVKIESCFIKTKLHYSGLIVEGTSLHFEKTHEFRKWLEKGTNIDTMQGNFIVAEVLERSPENNYQEVIVKPWYQK